MVTVYDVYPYDLIVAVAEKLKNIEGIKPPDQLMFWKSSSTSEIAPLDYKNFWYIRAASILRKIYMRNVIGINKLRKEYGERTRNHVHKKNSRPASGAIIRRCVQQLESAGLLKQIPKKGRTLTPQGISLLDKTASEIYKKNPIKPFTYFGIEKN
ncbi:MAG: 40S ribosomal protein S19 [Promethearchaeota archaeon]